MSSHNAQDRRHPEDLIVHGHGPHANGRPPTVNLPTQRLRPPRGRPAAPCQPSGHRVVVPHPLREPGDGAARRDPTDGAILAAPTAATTLAAARAAAPACRCHHRGRRANLSAPHSLSAVWVAAVAVAALLLIAGCSESDRGRPGATPAAIPTTSAALTTTKPPPGPPAAGAAIGDVSAWIQAADAADPAAYHSATRDGSVSQLQDNDVAFTTASNKTRCMTDSTVSSGDLACLVHLTEPPPRPQDIEGEWIGDWIEFDGPTLTVGSVHGDPGPFIYGDGPQLPSGKALKFGNYQCRADQAGLVCVNYAYQSAARMSDAGVEPFGCLHKVNPPPDIGEKFSC